MSRLAGLMEFTKVSRHLSSFEWWYSAQFAYCAVHSGFVPILIPTYVISITGRATDVGLVMAVMGIGALLAPVIGSWADRFHAYRMAQLAGLVSQVLGAVILAFSGSVLLIAAGGCLLGIGTATLIMINPVFILGAGFSKKEESLRLTRLSQIGRIGVLLGGLIVAALTQAGLSFSTRFLVMAGIPGLCLLLTAVTNRAAADRIQDAAREAKARDGTAKVPLRTVLASPFGLFLVAAIFARGSMEMFIGQYPNYMQAVFNISPALSAAAISVTALLTLVALDLSGRWMGRSGPHPVWLTAVGARIGAAGLLVLLSLLAPVSVILPLGVYVVLRQSLSCVNLIHPPLVSALSAAELGTTQGILLVALVIGFMAGNMSGGWLADTFGFRSLAWILAGMSAFAVLLGYIAIRRSRFIEQQEEPVAAQSVA